MTETERLFEKPERRQNKWDAVHLRTVGCKLRTDEAERFKILCSDLGTTQYAVVRLLVRRFMRQNGRH